MADSLQEVPIEKCIAREGFNSRHNGLGDLSGLIESIKVVGIKEPLLGVVMDNQKEEVEIYAGFRRLAAAMKAGLESVPVITRPRRAYTRAQRFEFNLIENMHRENLNPVDEALSFKRMITEYGIKEEELGSRLGVSQDLIKRRLELLKLEAVVSDAIHKGRITVKSGMEIDRLPRDLQSKYVGVAEKLQGVQLTKLVNRELEKLEPKETTEEKQKEKADAAAVTANIKTIKASVAVLVDDLGMPEDDATAMKEINYRLMDPDDITAMAKFMDKLADRIEDKVEFRDTATAAISEAVDGVFGLLEVDQEILGAIIGYIRDRAAEVAKASCGKSRPKVTYAVAKEVIDKVFSPGQESTEPTV